MSLKTLQLAEQLIACTSVTPSDGGCQAVLAARLQQAGFTCQTLVSGPADFQVTNLYAFKAGRQGGPILAFAGHTDVVPTGPLEAWHSDPFIPTHRDGKLYGRGAADMKTSLAAMVVAVEAFIESHPQHQGSIAFLLTSDEEGPANDGTIKLVEWLESQGKRLDMCIVGEPTSVTRLGDMIKNGRRGSLSGRLVVEGIQGHIAYPHLARNPIHSMAPALAELSQTLWDDGNDHFPPTSWQVSNIHAGTGATNVIPGEAVIDFNFRFSTESTPDQLKERVHAILDRHQLQYRLTWTLSGMPFLTRPGRLTNALTKAIHQVTGVNTELSTTGGTSDGRFIARVCHEVVEFGPLNDTIHKVNECVNVDDIEPLRAIYQSTLEQVVA